MPGFLRQPVYTYEYRHRPAPVELDLGRSSLTDGDIRVDPDDLNDG